MLLYINIFPLFHYSTDVLKIHYLSFDMLQAQKEKEKICDKKCTKNDTFIDTCSKCPNNSFDNNRSVTLCYQHVIAPTKQKVSR